MNRLTHSNHSNRTPFACSALLFAVVAPLMTVTAVHAEGTADPINPLSQFFRVRDVTTIGVDILDAGTERIRWTGQGNVVVTAPNNAVVATLTSGTSTGSLAAFGAGAYNLDLQASQTTAAWEVLVVNAADADVSGGLGRVFSQEWFLNLAGRQAANALNHSFFALVPGAVPNTDAVLEIDLSGMNGNNHRFVMNSRGAADAAGNFLGDGRSRPAGFTAPAEYRLYSRSPAIARGGVVTANIANLTFTPAAGLSSCDQFDVDLGGTFTFTSTQPGSYRVVCDTDGNGVTDITDADDLQLSGSAAAGTNAVDWDGTVGGNPVAEGLYSCEVFVGVGELHMVLEDVETSYPGFRMYEVSGAVRTPLSMFWDDSLLTNADVDMATPPIPAQPGLIASGAAGMLSGPVGSTPLANVDGRAWGNFSADGKRGTNQFTDTYAFARVSNRVALQLNGVSENTDDDGDGLTNLEECDLGTDPDDQDSDDDGVRDDLEVDGDTDSDGDGRINALDPDSDNDGLKDGTELGVTTPLADTDLAANQFVADVNSATTTDPTVDDTDGGGALDGSEDINGNGAVDGNETNPVAGNGADDDTDRDGLPNATDLNDLDIDSDDDGVTDGNEQQPLTDTDSDMLVNMLDFDSDDDGLPDGLEVGISAPAADPDGAGPIVATNVAAGNFTADGDAGATSTNPLNVDTDGGTVNDGVEDANRNGVRDNGETNPTVGNAADDIANPDGDGDGLTDAAEGILGTNPNDADSDDDGIADGAEPNPGDDFDGDGDINALDPDSDDDGLQDGTERGINTPVADPDGAAGPLLGTDAAVFIRDANPASTTDPFDPDSDNGGVIDGNEDINGNGDVDPGETNPVVNNAADDDSDSDGVPNPLDPNDADLDSDDDGVPDGEETPGDADGDGIDNISDPDSDNDGIQDGTELGLTAIVADPDGAGPIVGTDPARFQPDLDPASTTNPLDRDTDDGGIIDGREDRNGNGRVDANEQNPVSGNQADDILVDTDGDGLPDLTETTLGSDPLDLDTDDDGLGDGAEPSPGDDLDNDGRNSVLDPDSDADLLFDGLESRVVTAIADPDGNGPLKGTDVGVGNFRSDADPATRTDPQNADTDGGSVPDGAEDANLNGDIDPGETDPNVAADDVAQADTDGDGLTDGQEAALGTDPQDIDSDDDGVSDGREPSPGQDTDGDGLINGLDPDSDQDGLSDGLELGITMPIADPDGDGPIQGTDVGAGNFVVDADPASTTNPLDPDTDDGGVDDGVEDANQDGAVNGGETNPVASQAADDVNVDTDGDGLSNVNEEAAGTNPFDRDSDDDGVGDGDEPGVGDDPDGDGQPNGLDPDSDNDGLLDGTESGITTPIADPDGAGPLLGTNPAAGNFIADTDPNSVTDPTDPDTDDGGATDGSEDPNRNGAVDGGETNPVAGQGGDDSSPPNADTDGDGLTDALEQAIGSDPNDADTDDDGVGDGDEPNPASDGDSDGLPGVLDPDSDNDGLYDGTELGVVMPVADPDNNGPLLGTDPAAGNYIPDADQGSRTSPLDPDTDDGGVLDGFEDVDGNGRVDGAEINPNLGADDNTAPDGDEDGIPDATEEAIGSDPNDADSDDDGLIDGAEPNPRSDTDRDGLINLLDADSDDDGLYDGTEAGVTEAQRNPDTDLDADVFIADADPISRSGVLDPDTDDGGVLDGAEDANLDGAVDDGEGDVLVASDDALLLDTDGDGLPDATEVANGTDLDDADSDDDGVIDGAENNPFADTDGDGDINALDPDSDGDLLFDGTERGVTEADRNPDTDLAANRFIADEDPDSRTSPLDPDTDDGGVNDGIEDANGNGAVDGDETDPTAGNGADDVIDPAQDSDDDGIPDAVEDTDGDGVVDPGETDPQDSDSDGDDIPDGVEDSDRDGTVDAGETDPTNPDTDGDLVPDGVEDADRDGTLDTGETDPTDPDSDNDTLDDGDEDANRNGIVDDGETSPLDPDSDDDGICDEPTLVIAGICQPDAQPNGDVDGDGILDGVDNCVDLANADQANADGDALGDACDADADGDGYNDDLEVQGGGITSGCSQGGGVPTVFVGALVVLAMGRRRRRAA